MGGTSKNRKQPQPAPPAELWVTRDPGARGCQVWREPPVFDVGVGYTDGNGNVYDEMHDIFSTDRPLRYRLCEEGE